MIVDLEHKNNEANEKLVGLEDLVNSLKEELSSSKSSVSSEEIAFMQQQIQELVSDKLSYSETLEQKQSRIVELESEMSHADELLSEMENDGSIYYSLSIIIIIITTILSSNSTISTRRVTRSRGGAL